MPNSYTTSYQCLGSVHILRNYILGIFDPPSVIKIAIFPYIKIEGRNHLRPPPPKWLRNMWTLPYVRLLWTNQAVICACVNGLSICIIIRPSISIYSGKILCPSVPCPGVPCPGVLCPCVLCPGVPCPGVWESSFHTNNKMEIMIKVTTAQSISICMIIHFVESLMLHQGMSSR